MTLDPRDPWGAGLVMGRDQYGNLVFNFPGAPNFYPTTKAGAPLPGVTYPTATTAVPAPTVSTPSPTQAIAPTVSQPLTAAPASTTLTIAGSRLSGRTGALNTSAFSPVTAAGVVPDVSGTIAGRSVAPPTAVSTATQTAPTATTPVPAATPVTATTAPTAWSYRTVPATSTATATAPTITNRTVPTTTTGSTVVPPTPVTINYSPDGTKVEVGWSNGRTVTYDRMAWENSPYGSTPYTNMWEGPGLQPAPDSRLQPRIDNPAYQSSAFPATTSTSVITPSGLADWTTFFSTYLNPTTTNTTTNNQYNYIANPNAIAGPSGRDTWVHGGTEDAWGYYDPATGDFIETQEGYPGAQLYSAPGSGKQNEAMSAAVARARYAPDSAAYEKWVEDRAHSLRTTPEVPQEWTDFGFMPSAAIAYYQQNPTALVPGQPPPALTPSEPGTMQYTPISPLDAAAAEQSLMDWFSKNVNTKHIPDSDWYKKVREWAKFYQMGALTSYGIPLDENQPAIAVDPLVRLQQQLMGQIDMGVLLGLGSSGNLAPVPSAAAMAPIITSAGHVTPSSSVAHTSGLAYMPGEDWSSLYSSVDWARYSGRLAGRQPTSAQIAAGQTSLFGPQPWVSGTYLMPEELRTLYDTFARSSIAGPTATTTDIANRYIYTADGQVVPISNAIASQYPNRDAYAESGVPFRMSGSFGEDYWSRYATSQDTRMNTWGTRMPLAVNMAYSSATPGYSPPDLRAFNDLVAGQQKSLNMQLEQKGAGMGMPGVYRPMEGEQWRARESLANQAAAAYGPMRYQMQQSITDQTQQLLSAIAQADIETQKELLMAGHSV